MACEALRKLMQLHIADFCYKSLYSKYLFNINLLEFLKIYFFHPRF